MVCLLARAAHHCQRTDDVAGLGEPVHVGVVHHPLRQALHGSHGRFHAALADVCVCV